MKIGIVQSIIGGGGGNDMVLFSLLKKLKETNHAVTIYTIGEPRCDLKIYNFKKIKKLFPIKIPIFGLYQKMLEPLLAKKAQHEDVLIALTGDLFLPATKSQRVIFYSQNNFADPTKMNISKYKNGVWKYYYKPYKKMFDKFIKNIKQYNIEFLANSYYVRQQLKQHTGVEAKVIYPPVNLGEFTSNKTDKKGIITVTRFSQEKNLEKIIDLIGDIDCPKRIFGRISKVNTNYYNHIMQRGKNKNITFYSNQKRVLMKRLLLKSKIFISTSDETFGIAVIESIASGCIPIVPDTSAHRETVPFNELRPVGDELIKTRIKEALDGKYDYLIPKLQNHIRQFDESVFQNNFLEVISK